MNGAQSLKATPPMHHVECATAVNATRDSVEEKVSSTQGFSDDPLEAGQICATLRETWP